MDWLKMLAIAGMNGGGSGGSGGGASPEEVTTIVKEQFPGGVGYSEVGEFEIYRNENASGLEYFYQTQMALLSKNLSLKLGQRYFGVFDGVRYEGIAEEYSEMADGLIVDFAGDTSKAILSNPSDGFAIKWNDVQRPATIVISTEKRSSTIATEFLPEHLRFGSTPEKYFEWDGAYTDTGDNFIHVLTATSPDTGETMEVPVAFAKLTDEIVSRKQLVGDSTTSGAMWANGTTYPVVIEDSFVYSSGTYQMVMTPYGNGPLLFSGPKGVAVFSVTLDGAEMQCSCTLPSDGTYVYAMDGDEVYALETVEDITPISAKYMPKVADLSGTWIADLKAALGI